MELVFSTMILFCGVLYLHSLLEVLGFSFLLLSDVFIPLLNVTMIVAPTSIYSEMHDAYLNVHFNSAWHLYWEILGEQYNIEQILNILIMLNVISFSSARLNCTVLCKYSWFDSNECKKGYRYNLYKLHIQNRDLEKEKNFSRIN